MSEKTLDPRAENTKGKIKQAFKQLIKEKPFHVIKVKDITQFAHINRSTFYAHYQDIYQLLNDIVVEGETLFDRPASSDDIYIDPESFIDRFQKSLDFSKQNKDLRLILLSHFINSAYYRSYVETFVEKEYALESAVRAKDPSYTSPDKILAYFCMGGINQLVCLWITEDLPYTSREMAIYAAKLNILIIAAMAGVDPNTLPISKVKGWHNP